MVEVKPGESDGRSSDEETSAEETLNIVEALIDLATSRYIEEDQQNLVVQSESEIWQWICDAGYAGGPEAAKTADVVTNHGDQSVTVEITMSQDIESNADGKVTFYVEHGEAWNAIRKQFEYVKSSVEYAMSFSRDGLDSSAVDMQIICDGLKPSSDMASNADALLSTNISDFGSKDKMAGAFEVSDNWSAAPAVSSALADWTGIAAETFRGVYTDRIPSIAAGQLMVAMVLEQSISTVAAAFKNLRSETALLIIDVINYLDVYPISNLEIDGVPWNTILTAVSGAATIVAGIAAPIPGPGTAISVTATIIAGAATLGAMVVEDPVHQELVSTPVPIEGDTVTQIMGNFKNRIDAYITAAENAEKVMAKAVSGYTEFFTDKTARGITVHLTHGGELSLSQWNSFFALKEPAIADVSSDTSYSKVSDIDLMGKAPDQGESFAGNLQKLLRSGHDWLPDMASTFDSFGSKGADEGLQDGFTREHSGYNNAVGEFTSSDAGPLYPVWIELYEAFNSMVSQTSSNLNAAAEGLIAAAEAFAGQDHAAASELRESSELY